MKPWSERHGNRSTNFSTVLISFCQVLVKKKKTTVSRLPVGGGGEGQVLYLHGEGEGTGQVRGGVVGVPHQYGWCRGWVAPPNKNTDPFGKKNKPSLVQRTWSMETLVTMRFCELKMNVNFYKQINTQTLNLHRPWFVFRRCTRRRDAERGWFRAHEPGSSSRGDQAPAPAQPSRTSAGPSSMASPRGFSTEQNVKAYRHGVPCPYLITRFADHSEP